MLDESFIKKDLFVVILFIIKTMKDSSSENDNNSMSIQRYRYRYRLHNIITYNYGLIIAYYPASPPVHSECFLFLVFLPPCSCGFIASFPPSLLKEVSRLRAAGIFVSF